MNTEKDKMPTKMLLNEGSITLRGLQPEEIEKLRTIEADNQAKPFRSLARYMPLITAAAITVEPRAGAQIPADMSPLDYMLGTEAISREWDIVRTLYDLSGIAFNEAIQTASEAEGERIGRGGAPDEADVQ